MSEYSWIHLILLVVICLNVAIGNTGVIILTAPIIIPAVTFGLILRVVAHIYNKKQEANYYR